MSGRRSKLGRIGLLALLATVVQAAVAGAQGGPRVESATPTAVRQGDVMTLTGSGFRARAADHRVWLGGGGAAVWADVLAVGSGQLVVEVGPVPAAGVETLTLWTGEGFDLPDGLLATPGRTWLLAGASWFVAAGEGGFAPVTLLEPSPETSGGRIEGGELRAEVVPPPPDPPCTPEEEGGFGCFEIEIKVVATPDPDPDPPPPEGVSERSLPATATPATAGGIGVAASLSMRLIAAAAPPDPDALAADVAQALTQTFGPLGLAAAAAGPEVVVSYGGGIGDGSLVIARVPR